ncbi:hypothetical protein A0J61_04473 [Choanephora cucurbitarum]|uniref:Uncharacterized protein n=1 Tax=Choanephora cucurbitarum TaxID=101091 RepID=A0A1C7NEG8_9FUNG|nr:hypothetical protein A0J61_04473 [Choanephora cucurbitarum]
MSLIDEHLGEFYHNLFGGPRNLVGNNETGYILPSMKENMYACFKRKDAFGVESLFVGQIINSMIHQFSVCKVTAEDTAKNVLRAYECYNVYSIEEVVMECVLDMHTQHNGFHLINLSKFGTYWFFYNKIGLTQVANALN